MPKKEDHITLHWTGLDEIVAAQLCNALITITQMTVGNLANHPNPPKGSEPVRCAWDYETNLPTEALDLASAVYPK